MGSNHETNEGQKSRDTLPLNALICNVYNFAKGTFFDFKKVNFKWIKNEKYEINIIFRKYGFRIFDPVHLCAE